MQKQDKLKRILSFLNGSLSFDALRPPKNYVAFLMDGIYDIENLRLTESEFLAWEKLHLREIDTITIFKEQLTHAVDAIGGNETVFLIPKNDRETLPGVTSNNEVITAQIKPIEEEKPDLVIEHRVTDLRAKKAKKKAEAKKKEQVIVERIEEPAMMARSGKLSNYGTSWVVADRSYYNPL